MPTGLTEIVLAAVVVFYLLAVVRKTPVERPLFFWVGLGAVIVALLAHFFTLGSAKGLRITFMVFQILMSIVALKCYVIGMYAGKLPVNVPGEQAPPKE